jgi:predicted dehydrogenase
MSPRKVRWGIIGATSRVARDYVIPAICASERAEIVAVASRSIAAAEESARNCPGTVHAYNDYDSVLADELVDVVYIPLPNSLHIGWTVDAIHHGKHVLCEEPLAVNSAEADEMIELAQSNGVVLTEGFMYYYHPMQREIEQAVRSGKIGDVNVVRASVSFMQTEETDYRRNPRMGGGALLDIGSYCVHIARHVFAREPIAVSAHMIVDEVTGVDTTTTAQLEFEGGGMATLDCSFAAAARSCYEIAGTAGTITVPKFFLRAGEPGIYTIADTHGVAETMTTAAADMFELEVDAVSRAVQGEAGMVLPPNDSLFNMKVIDAIAEGARSQQRVTL